MARWTSSRGLGGQTHESSRVTILTGQNLSGWAAARACLALDVLQQGVRAPQAAQLVMLLAVTLRSHWLAQSCC